MMYNKLVLDYFFNPKHVGILDKHQADIVHCSIVQAKQNTRMDLFWRIDKKGLIQRSCYKAVGSPYSIAALEWLCRQVEGKFLSDLPQLDYQALIEQLEIPKLQYPAAVQVEALFRDMVLLSKERNIHDRSNAP